MSVWKIGQFLHLNQKEIGWIQYNTFYTRRESSKHYFRLFEGYAISQEVLEFLEYQGVDKIVIYVDGTTEYHASTHDFLRAEKWDFQNDTQRVLSCSKMERQYIAQSNKVT